MKKRTFDQEEKRKLQIAKQTVLARDLVEKFELIEGGNKVKVTFTTGKISIYNVKHFLI
ncbi:hypothetical protein HN858_03270 [Candidatus Falkowbacteria bacterium]|jgi:hypothetical protein|nr:hypothetical protein [Candidatus Falkowbacteria bacterium]MBT5503090.1 hypothetical protein [Candidatus Falkowbacteria bacterium]MBT6574184.1 hypothetical protein [Candidatus Falkowbacteria bacterium]MBT7348669.1 hypothetical protein [Candidatus Falkowbacteria bacterium]MBT7500459.1 hypothetical protein [Candidatus Falkowbacteria bacterium]